MKQKQKQENRLWWNGCHEILLLLWT